jgi:hypothetical protein
MDKLWRTRTFQPVLTDSRSIVPTGWFGTPQHATASDAVTAASLLLSRFASADAEIKRGTGRFRKLSYRKISSEG